MATLDWRIGFIFLLNLTLPAVHAPASPQALDQGPHHIRWRVTNQVQTAQGLINVPSEFVQLETGLNRWDQNTASWVVTDAPRFELFQDGAVIRNLQWSAIFTPSVADPGAIDILLPSGERMIGQIMGLSYTFGDQSVLVTEIKPCPGEVSGNQLIFRSAFTGYDIDVIFKAERAGLSQWLTIKEQLPHPRAFFPEAQAEDVHVELLTEWTEAPVPSKESRIIEPAANGQRALTHERIRIGSVEFLGGRAFGINGDNTLAVASSWETISGRTFLLEKISWRKLAPELQKLPPAQARVGPGVPAAPRPLPPRRMAKTKVKPIQMAQAPVQVAKGLLWDWELGVTADKQIWRPDTTYYFSGAVTVKTNEFWGNTCLKFSPTNSAKLTITGPITCYSGMFQPITLTARDDHGIGDAVGTNVLSGFYGDTYLYLDSYTSGFSYTLDHFRIRHAATGIFFWQGTSHVLNHFQMVNSKVGFSTYYAEMSVRNGLFYNVNTNIVAGGTTALRAENCTFYTNQMFNVNSITLNPTNCIFAEITALPYYSGDNNFSFSSGSSVFVSRLAGKAYLLPTASPRNGGTTNINATLLADLRQRTHSPPIIISNSVTLDTVWTRQVLRDTDLLDAGYAYDPIDVAISAVAVSNATLVITGGVAVALFSANGIYLYPNSHLISAGTPHSLNRFIHHNAVQEQTDYYFNPSDARTVFTYWSGNVTAPSLNFRWTGFDVPGPYPYHIYADYGSASVTNAVVRDCQFRGGQIYLYENDTGAITFTNNLFEYNSWYAWDNKHLRFHNNLFVGAAGFLNQTLTNQNWSFTDNLVDNSTLLNWSPGMVHDYNAFYNSADFYSTYNTNANEKILTSLGYDTGRLARYYLRTNSTLLDAGSTTNAALIGLYSFTTLTNNLRELTNHLDISWHLPALDSNSLLLDQDLDGIPDAFEDHNGNGVFDSALGETDWSTYNSLFGIGPGPGLVVFTPLK